jgi:stalled ribosome alternative rescue factor ArfA
MKKRKLSKTNPIAKEVRTPKFRPRVVKSKKGKGSYKRQKGIV